MVITLLKLAKESGFFLNTLSRRETHPPDVCLTAQAFFDLRNNTDCVAVYLNSSGGCLLFIHFVTCAPPAHSLFMEGARE